MGVVGRAAHDPQPPFIPKLRDPYKIKRDVLCQMRLESIIMPTRELAGENTRQLF